MIGTLGVNETRSSFVEVQCAFESVFTPRGNGSKNCKTVFIKATSHYENVILFGLLIKRFFLAFYIKVTGALPVMHCEGGGREGRG